MTILHFRAVIDGVDASRRTLDLDASSFALLSFLSFPTLIQLVPTQTRRARLPVCARKPLGGQVLFTARTISRPIVVVVDDDTTRPHRHLFRRRSRARVQRSLCFKRERYRHRSRAARFVDGSRSQPIHREVGYRLLWQKSSTSPAITSTQLSAHAKSATQWRRAPSRTFIKPN